MEQLVGEHTCQERQVRPTSQDGSEQTKEAALAFLEHWVVVRYQNVNMLCKLSVSKSNERICCRPGRRLKPSPSDSAHSPALALLGPQRQPSFFSLPRLQWPTLSAISSAKLCTLLCLEGDLHQSRRLGWFTTTSPAPSTQ